MREFSDKRYLVAEIAYDGSAFYGSQIQTDKPSINGKLQEVFKSFGLYGKVLAAGRTDKGVHALRNVVAIELTYEPKELEWLKAQMNKKLFPHIYIHTLRICSSDFHPRFLAKARHYRYIISKRPLQVFNARYFYYHEIQDTSKIHKAISIFEGVHDFSYFSKATPVPDKVKTIYFAKFYSYKDFFIFSFKGNGFLHSQVRFMVSALLMLDEGKMNLNQIKDQLSLKKRYIMQAAPPQGLYLCRVFY